MPASRIPSESQSRARSNALLLVAFASLVAVPLPALLAYFSEGLAQQQLGDALALLGPLVSASPVYALPPFVLGGGIGCLAYCTITAPAHTRAIARSGEARLDRRALVASSLVGAALFASAGLVVGLTVFRIVG